MKRIIVTTILCVAVLMAIAQERRQTINKEYNLSGPSKVLRISNVSGFIKVEGYDGQKVTMEIDEHIKAKSQSSLDELIANLGVAEEEYGDTLEVYINSPCGCDCKRGSRYNWNNCNYQGSYTYDFTVKVPRNLNISVSTVNRGTVEVTNVRGRISARNVNGAIYLKGVSEAQDVYTVNGDVEIDYVSLPKENSKYYTLNGDLTVLYPSTLSADMSFKSFNGDFYTNFSITERLPAVSTSTRESSKGTVYKLHETTLVRVGSGGVKLDFETFNGDIFIKKNQ